MSSQEGKVKQGQSTRRTNDQTYLLSPRRLPMKTRIVILITSCLAAARRSLFPMAALFALVTSGNAQWIFNPATGHEYRLTCGEYWGASDTSVPTPPDWFDAEAEAVAFGGHLATINDEAENLWLR